VLTKRIIACLDVVHGVVTKAQQFQDNIEIRPALDVMSDLYQDGIDEIIFYDIKASAERRQIDLETVRSVSDRVFVPFTVGGGIRNIEDMYSVLNAGAEKISIDSMAVRNPDIITEGAKAFGNQCIVVSMQTKQVEKTQSIPSGHEIAIDGARVFTGMDAIEWAKKAVDMGAGELCINSIDKDGTHSGYDIELLEQVCSNVNVPVIASGGAGTPDHISDVFLSTGVSAAIISSMLYSPRLPRNFSCEEIKAHLLAKNVHVRPHAELPAINSNEA